MSTCTILFPLGRSVICENPTPSAIIRSEPSTSSLTKGADVAMDPGHPFVVLGNDALGPPGGDYRCLEPRGEGEHLLPERIGPPAGHDDRPLGGIDDANRLCQLLRVRCDVHRSETGLAGACRGIQGLLLHIVRNGYLRHPFPEDGELQGQMHESSGQCLVVDGVVVLRDGPEEGVLVDLLVPPGPVYWNLTCPLRESTEARSSIAS